MTSFPPGLSTRVAVANLHLTLARTTSELSEMSLEEIGKRALEAGYKLGYRNSEVSLKRWVSAGAQNVYAVAP